MIPFDSSSDEPLPDTALGERFAIPGMRNAFRIFATDVCRLPMSSASYSYGWPATRVPFCRKRSTGVTSPRIWTAVAERSGDTAFRVDAGFRARRGAALPAAVQERWVCACTQPSSRWREVQVAEGGRGGVGREGGREAAGEGGLGITNTAGCAICSSSVANFIPWASARCARVRGIHPSLCGFLPN